MRALAQLVIEKALAVVLGLFLLLTAFRGGNTDLAMNVAVIGALVLLILATASLAIASAPRARLATPSVLLLAALMMLLGAGVLALLPLPAEAWLALPGRDFYAPILKLLAAPEIQAGSLPLTLDAIGTRRAIMMLCVCIAIAVSTQLLSRTSLLALLGAVALLAVIESAIGFLQLGLRGAASVVVLDYAGHARASGTFVNKNHFATLLAMALPILILRAAGHYSFFVHGDRGNTLANFWWGVAAAFVGAALVASLSRAGVFAGAAAGAAAVGLCLYRQHEVSRRTFWLGLAIFVLFLVLVATAGLQGLLKSITSSALQDGASGRALMVAQTWNGIVAFFPLGAGLGSFSIAFPRFQEASLPGYVEYAHNDYLQLLLETGAIGLVALALIGIAAMLVTRTIWKTIRGEERLPAGTACLLSALAFALHAWFDFPAHIPAIAVVATLLFSAAMNEQLNIVGRKRRVAERFDGPLLRQTTPYPRAAPVPVSDSLPVAAVSDTVLRDER